MPLNPNQTHTILNALGHSPNKKLGQNFLIDGNIVRKSIELAGIYKNEAIVEIGPGLGTLSKAILSTGAQLFAVEKDKTLANYLEETISKDSDNFHLLNNFTIFQFDNSIKALKLVYAMCRNKNSFSLSFFYSSSN